MSELSEEEKGELKRTSVSSKFKYDMEKMAEVRHARGNVNMDLDDFMAFLGVYNGFVNHQPRRFRKIEGGKWRV